MIWTDRPTLRAEPQPPPAGCRPMRPRPPHRRPRAGAPRSPLRSARLCARALAARRRLAVRPAPACPPSRTTAAPRRRPPLGFARRGRERERPRGRGTEGAAGRPGLWTGPNRGSGGSRGKRAGEGRGRVGPAEEVGWPASGLYWAVVAFLFISHLFFHIYASTSLINSKINIYYGK